MNIEIQTFSVMGQDGMPVVLITAYWRGHVIQIDCYRASDMAVLEMPPINALHKAA